ncbi:hypothetical protein ABZX51_007473 [Aspergillus tubingensis]
MRGSMLRTSRCVCVHLSPDFRLASPQNKQVKPSRDQPVLITPSLSPLGSDLNDMSSFLRVACMAQGEARLGCQSVSQSGVFARFRSRLLAVPALSAVAFTSYCVVLSPSVVSACVGLQLR